MTPHPREIVATVDNAGLPALIDHGITATLRLFAAEELARRINLRRVRWSFDDDDNARDGFTDDTTWNGFLNVWVTPAVHRAVIAAMDDEADDAGLRSMRPDPATGLVSYAEGFTAQEVES